MAVTPEASVSRRMILPPDPTTAGLISWSTCVCVRVCALVFLVYVSEARSNSKGCFARYS